MHADYIANPLYDNQLLDANYRRVKSIISLPILLFSITTIFFNLSLLFVFALAILILEAISFSDFCLKIT